MRVAIIDIGTNAIRAAVYKDNNLGSYEIYNEKFKCDLSNLLENNDIDIRHGSYYIIGYFSKIFKRLKVDKIDCVATEVLRNSDNAKKFVNLIKEKFDININILDGNEEAKLSAQGMILGIPDADGIAADLGGGSLELAEIRHESIFDVKSLPLGTKILSKQHIENTDYIIKTIKNEFATHKVKNLYLIGGALRLVGRCYMDYAKNIVKNLHNLVISPDVFIDFLNQLENLQKFHKFSKRYKVNKHGITVLKALIEIFAPDNLVFSTYGLKEGVRYSGIEASNDKISDLLLSRIFSILNFDNNSFDVESYSNLLNQIGIEENEFLQKSFIYSALLSQNIHNIDRNYKCEYLLNFILTTDIPFNQIQRSMIYHIIGHLHCHKFQITNKQFKKVLNKNEIIYSSIIASLIKICLFVDGVIYDRPTFRINEKDRFLEIETDLILPKAIFDGVCENLKNIAIMKKKLISLNN